MWKCKWQTVLNICGLAVGFACFVFWMTAVGIRLPNDFADVERSFYVGYTQHPQRKEIPLHQVDNLLQQFPQIEQFTWFTYSRREYLSTVDNNASSIFQAEIMSVHHDYFRFYSVDLDAGIIPAGEEQGLVIDSKYARKMFGNESPLGRTVYINHEAWTIVGIANLQGFSWPADIYRLNDRLPANGNVRLMVKLYEGASIQDFTDIIRKIEIVKPDGATDFLRATPMDTTANMVTSFVIIKFFTTLIGSLLLIVALVNYISCSLSRFYRRTKECGIRKVHGCNRRNLFMLFFNEVFIALIIAGIIAFQLCGFLVNMYNNTTVDHVDFSEAAGNFIYYFVWSVALALLLCLPVVGRIERMGLLSSIASKPTSRRRLFFIGVQMFISISLVFFSSWMLLQFYNFFSSAYPGLSKQEKREIVMMNPEILRAIDRDLPNRIVSEVTSNADVITATRFNSYSRLVAQPADATQKITTNVFHIDDQYASFFKIRLLEGQFPLYGEPGVVTVDRKLSEILGGNNLIGQTIEIQGDNNDMQLYAIIGICERTPLHIHVSRDNNPTCYVSGEEDLLQEVYLKINPHNYRKAVSNIRKQTDEYSKVIPAFAVKTLEDRIAGEGAKSAANFILMLAGIALLLSLFGVYSSVSMDAESRRREVAIRKVNGAEKWHIFLLFGKSYLIVSVIAWFIAVFAVKPFIRLMSSNIELADRYNLTFSAYLIVLMVIIVITVSTIFNKVWSISKIKPSEVMKSE